MPVRAWKETVIIPTYEIGEAERYPVFLEKRVYQGSSGVVYPHAVVESISTQKVDKEWNVIYAENDYIKIMVIPDLGGRIQMAYDKIKERHFIYHNQVIKPALVGLTGPWISGGIEFNWPQHHRPSTFQPIDSLIEEHEDGSVTIWVSEMEKMFGLKGMAGFTLRPSKAYIEITGKILNRTPFPQTFLWWANPAVAVNDAYQSIFPPDVHAVYDHGKRDVSTFPIATGEYYKVDYSPGTDISRYKNIPVPTSFMAVNSKYDFVGSYEHDTQAGMLHVSDHHFSPGKKQWTWGNGDFGKAWDRNLTDEDGPYIEIMCGVFTDNQPDFTWIQAHEEKVFTQYFLPFHTLGGVKNASKDLLLNVDSEEEGLAVKIYATSKQSNLHVKLFAQEKLVFEDEFDLIPQVTYEQILPLTAIAYEDVYVEISNQAGDVLLAYRGESTKEQAVPDPAKAPDFPVDVEHIEDLYFIGQHLEQYRHATYEPLDYYKEALKRDSSDLRCNNAVGLINLRKGKLAEAQVFFEKAIDKLTKRNPNPSTGQFHYNLALTMFLQDEKDKAFDLFNKACWCADQQDKGNYFLAAILNEQGKYKEALKKIEQSLVANSHNHKARFLKVHLLYKLKRVEDAKIFAKGSMALDRFNFSLLLEQYFWSQVEGDRNQIMDLMRCDVHNFLECAHDFAEIGDYQKAINTLELLMDCGLGNPMVYYTLGVYQRKLGLEAQGNESWKMAEGLSLDYCFPNRLREILVLQEVVEYHPKAANAEYLRGNYWYSKKEHQLAAEAWEKSIAIDGKNPIAHRNLALYYFNKVGDQVLAKKHLETAFSLDGENARLLMELDQFYKKTNRDVEYRVELLSKNWKLVLQRDDLYLEYVTLLNLSGRNEEALSLIEKRTFQPWEGGEGKVPAQYLLARIELAKALIKQGDYNEARDHLLAAQTYPENLGEGKLYGARENDVFYWLGVACEGGGEIANARAYWIKGAAGDTSIGQAFFYNDQQPDKVFYQGLCLLKLGRFDEAKPIFERLVTYGEEHLNDKIYLDYFAISLPDLLIWEEDLDLRNRINCLYLGGLGQLGLGETANARYLFKEALAHDVYHLGAKTHFHLLEQNHLINGTS